MEYRIHILREAVEEAIGAEATYRRHTHEKLNIIDKGKGSYIKRLNSWQRDNDLWFVESNEAWNKVRDMCRLIGTDEKSVIAIEKAIIRQQEKTDWEKVLTPDEEAYRRNVAEKN